MPTAIARMLERGQSEHFIGGPVQDQYLFNQVAHTVSHRYQRLQALIAIGQFPGKIMQVYFLSALTGVDHLIITADAIRTCTPAARWRSISPVNPASSAQDYFPDTTRRPSQSIASCWRYMAPMAAGLLYCRASGTP